ncbi:MAG: hypothetical protein OEY86_16935 [Nitrospira sp.]|nr:hypothetical protein [Nitrospira sp.]
MKTFILVSIIFCSTNVFAQNVGINFPDKPICSTDKSVYLEITNPSNELLFVKIGVEQSDTRPEMDAIWNPFHLDITSNDPEKDGNQHIKVGKHGTITKIWNMTDREEFAPSKYRLTVIPYVNKIQKEIEYFYFEVIECGP